MSLIQLLQQQGLTADQANRLASLTVRGYPLLAVNDRDSLYSIVSMVKQLDFEQAMTFIDELLNRRSFDSIVQAVDAIVYDSQLLAKVRSKTIADLDNFRRKKSTAKGLYTCRACGSKETVSVEKQLRSADEPMTLIITCVVCGKTWRQ